MSTAHEIEDTIALLSRTPAALDALLRGLPATWTLRNEGEGTWSALEIIGHLIHGERTDWIARAKLIVQFDDPPPFESFDRLGHVRESAGQTLDQLLDEFARIRAENLDQLRAWNLRPEDLERRGRHPSLGAVTLSQLLATWATHDLSHLHQLSRVMAHQYREHAGPWTAYLLRARPRMRSTTTRANAHWHLAQLVVREADQIRMAAAAKVQLALAWSF